MALWIMGFGGTVPIGNLIAGPLIEATSVTTVVLAGAVIALGLAVYADLEARADDPADARPTPTDHAAQRVERGRRARRSRPATRLPLTSTASPSPSVAEGRERLVDRATSSPP